MIASAVPVVNAPFRTGPVEKATPTAQPVTLFSSKESHTKLFEVVHSRQGNNRYNTVYNNAEHVRILGMRDHLVGEDNEAVDSHKARRYAPQTCHGSYT